jgi:hypothetical protein
MATGDNSRAQRSLTYGPRRVWVNSGLTALVLAATPGVIALIGLGWPWGYAAAVLALAVGLWSAQRALRIRLVITEQDVRVDNYWKSHGFPWGAVEGVGIGSKGLLPRPALLFRRTDEAPVLAMATPLRQEERHDFLTAVLSFAPHPVLRLRDAPAQVGFLGADWALSNKIRLWWLGEPRRPERQASEQVWPEPPFGFSLLLAAVVLVGAVLALVLGVSLFVGSIASGAPGSHYLIALLLVAAGCVGCAALVAFRRRILRRG